jgi:ABC-2 type transport system ATP-binding protein
MLLGLIRPSGGSARLFGRDPMIDGVRALEGVAGFVEAPRFYPYLSGRKNLELVAALDGGDASSQIDAALDTVDLVSRAKDRVGGYSHGMRQRLGIAGALIRRPRLLLLDEPATGLDPAGMRDMRALIRNLADSGITVLLSSHLMNEVEELCNRVAIIRAGRIVYEGRLDDLRASAAGSYTLRTSDDATAAQICALQTGIRELVVTPDGIRVRADEAAIERLSLELARSEIALRALVPDHASLEERFFALTEDPVDPPAGAPTPELERVA